MKKLKKRERERERFEAKAASIIEAWIFLWILSFIRIHVFQEADQHFHGASVFSANFHWVGVGGD